ncbi:MAG: hypothetical protein ACXVRJ_14415 [Gaiellaceae bacterium]
MPGWLYAGIVVVFVVAGVMFVRSTQRRAFVERLPLEPDEDVLLEEEGLKLFHRSRQRAVRGGGTVTHRVRALLTNRRILLATGGPEGKHKFVILMILDYTTPARPVPESGYAAYTRKFELENGYPTYPFSATDVSLEAGRADAAALRIDVPFLEAGPNWGKPPEVKLFTKQAERYREAIAGRSAGG